MAQELFLTDACPAGEKMDLSARRKPAFIIINRNVVENVDLQEALQSRLACEVMAVLSLEAIHQAALSDAPVRAIFLSAEGADLSDPWLSDLSGSGTRLVLIDGDSNEPGRPGYHVLQRPFSARSVDMLITALMSDDSRE
jgi:hypothetical protein